MGWELNAGYFQLDFCVLVSGKWERWVGYFFVEFHFPCDYHFFFRCICILIELIAPLF